MAAYRTANRLFPGLHTPLLGMGMEYQRMNNLQLAEQMFLQVCVCGGGGSVWVGMGRGGAQKEWGLWAECGLCGACCLCATCSWRSRWSCGWLGRKGKGRVRLLSMPAGGSAGEERRGFLQEAREAKMQGL